LDDGRILLNRRGIFGNLWALALILAASGPVCADEPLVAAAASLRPVLPEIMENFEKTHGVRPRAAFGSSGILYRQIRRGAPFALFLSADPAYTARLAAEGRTEAPGPVTYALGRIALYARKDSPLAPERGCAGLARLIDQGRLRRFAIPNPEHAPYGRAAREFLEGCGLWERIRPHLVIGENAAQAAGFAVQRAAQGGIVPLSLASSPRLRSQGRYWVVPADRHTPLRHEMVLLEGADGAARAFFDHLRGPRAREALEAAGFTVPGAAP
jgi:molybdate transport system substrate-binding protein